MATANKVGENGPSSDTNLSLQRSFPVSSPFGVLVEISYWAEC